jgi:hypothetical protein
MLDGNMGIENDSTTRKSFINSLDDFDRHRPLLFSIAYRMLGSVTDAELIANNS